MTRRVVACLWLAGIVVSLSFLGRRFYRGDMIDTSLLSLLPAAESDPFIKEANATLSQRASYLMVFLVGHPDAGVAAQLGQRFKNELQKSNFVRSSLTEISPEQQAAFRDLYFPLRYQMLSPQDRRWLQENKSVDRFMDRLAGSLYSPASSFTKGLIPHDPFLFFPELARSWIQTSAPGGLPSGGAGGLLNAPDGLVYSAAAVELKLDPFNSKNQDQMIAWLENQRQTLRAEHPDSRVWASGVLPFAAAERKRTEREIATVSLGTGVGVLLLMVWAFASGRAILLSMVPISVGLLSAVAATVFVFGHVHVITLAFGATLIGVADDYPLFILSHYRMTTSAWNPHALLKRIAPELFLGAATTLLGYIALSIAPFPGLRQMALFSSVGIAAALITVLLWFPTLFRQPPAYTRAPHLFRWGQILLSLISRLWEKRGEKPILAITALAAVLCLMGLMKIHFDDDIRRLQRPPEAVVKEADLVHSLIKGIGGNRFILIRGDSVEQLLERQDALLDRLLALIQSGTLSSVQSLAPFLPSQARQTEDRRLLRDGFRPHAARIKAGLERLGLSPQVGQDFFAALEKTPAYLSVDEWLGSPASQTLRSLWIGNTPHGVGAAALVGGLSDAVVLRASLKGLAGVTFFDQVEEYTALFRRYRHLGMGLLLAAFLGVWVLLVSRYGVRAGTLTLIPSILAVVATFALFGWLGIPLHLIHCLSVLLVLSMGSDYAIYFAECVRSGGDPTPTVLAVVLCASGTLLTFGLLALCRTPVLSAVGSTVFVGMLIAFIFSPLPYLAAKMPPRVNELV